MPYASGIWDRRWSMGGYCCQSESRWLKNLSFLLWRLWSNFWYYGTQSCLSVSPSVVFAFIWVWKCSHVCQYVLPAPPLRSTGHNTGTVGAGGWWPRKGLYCVRQISRGLSDSNRLGSAGSERVIDRADPCWVAGALWWASRAWCLRVESGRCWVDLGAASRGAKSRLKRWGTAEICTGRQGSCRFGR
jgi:hypothetical protein